MSQPHHRYFQVVLHDEGFALEILKDNRLAFVGITMVGTGSRCPLRVQHGGA
jgi:hypothetical protein